VAVTLSKKYSGGVQKYDAIVMHVIERSSKRNIHPSTWGIIFQNLNKSFILFSPCKENNLLYLPVIFGGSWNNQIFKGPAGGFCQ